MRLFVFDRNDPAAVSAVKKLTKDPPKAGMFIPLTTEEFAAFRDSIMSVDIDDPPADG